MEPEAWHSSSVPRPIERLAYGIAAHRATIAPKEHTIRPGPRRHVLGPGRDGDHDDLLRSGSPVRPERFSHSCEEVGLVNAAGDLHALELAVELDIGVIVASVLVEVKERSVAPGKVAAPALSQLRELAQLPQQRCQLIKVLLRCMTHTSSITLDVGQRKEAGDPACDPRANVGGDSAAGRDRIQPAPNL
jgi:hypothetical protein